MISLQPQRRGLKRPLPSNMREAIEDITGFDMRDVVVHYDSPLPACLGVSAFAYGTHIHLGSGAEHALAHEAWHIVQQKQGRICYSREICTQPFCLVPELEREADVMGVFANALASRGWRGSSFAGGEPKRALKQVSIVRPVVQPWVDITNDPNLMRSRRWETAEALLDQLNLYVNVNEYSHPGISYVVERLMPRNLVYKSYQALLADVDNVCKPLFGYQHERKMRQLMEGQQQAKKIYEKDLRGRLQQAREEHEKKYANTKKAPQFDEYRWINRYVMYGENREYIVWQMKSSYASCKVGRNLESASTPLFDELLDPEPSSGFANAMNCWEAVLYSAYQARLITAQHLLWAIQEKTCLFQENFLTGYGYDPVLPKRKVKKHSPPKDEKVPLFLDDIFRNYSCHLTRLSDEITAGVLRFPDEIPRGQIVVFGGGGHVALSTGNKREIKDETASKIYGYDQGHEILELDVDYTPLKGLNGQVKETIRASTIQDRCVENSFYGLEIWTGWLPNCSDSQLTVRYTSKKIREMKREYLVNEHIQASDIYNITNLTLD